MPKIKEGDYDLETGLFDDLDGTITGAWFGPPTGEYAVRSGSTDPVLTLSLTSDGLEKPMEQTYSIGAAKQWQVAGGGKEVISGKSPENHRFNLNTRAGALVSRMISLVGEGDRAKGQAFFKARDCYMTEAGFYLGLAFHWKREPLPVVSSIPGEAKTTSDVLLPVAYLGVVKAAAAGGDDTLERLIALAEGKTEREVRQALTKDPGLKDNKDLMHQIFNKGLLAQLVKDGKLVVGPDSKFI